MQRSMVSSIYFGSTLFLLSRFSAQTFHKWNAIDNPEISHLVVKCLNVELEIERNSID